MPVRAAGLPTPKGQKKKKRARKGQPGWRPLCRNMCGPLSLNREIYLRTVVRFSAEDCGPCAGSPFF